MNTLRDLALLPQPDFCIREPATPRDVVLLRCFDTRTYGSSPQTQQTPLHTVDSICTDADEWDKLPDLTGSLTLVCVPRDDVEMIGLGPLTFFTLYSHFGLEARFIHLLRTNRYGLHHVHYEEGHGYYINTVLYTLIWSYDMKACRTRAILLLRDSSKIYYDAYNEFIKILEKECEKLHNPLTLAWVALIHLSNWIDQVTYAELTAIRRLEGITGHGPYGGLKLEGEVTMDSLTKAQRRVGSVLADLANQARHVEIGLTIALHLVSRFPADGDAGSIYKPDGDPGPGYTKQELRPTFWKEVESFVNVVSIIQATLNDSRAYVAYLQERARNQSAVVTALMTHEDALINIRLAQASKQLAEAAKKDSSSMKTIAVMTMLFLPGTFFASLWSVPSLQWDNGDGWFDVVVRRNFWMYWAFTIPSTIIVFSVWLMLHQQQRLRQQQEKAEISAKLDSGLTTVTTDASTNGKKKSFGSSMMALLSGRAWALYSPLRPASPTLASTTLTPPPNGSPHVSSYVHQTSVPIAGYGPSSSYPPTSVPAPGYGTSPSYPPTSVPAPEIRTNATYPPTSIPIMSAMAPAPGAGANRSPSPPPPAAPSSRFAQGRYDRPPSWVPSLASSASTQP